MPCALEVADQFTLAAARRRTGSRQLDGLRAMIMVELDGQEKSVRGETPALEKLLRAHRPRLLRRAYGREQCEQLWQLRREFSFALRDTGLIKLNEDIVVPRGRLEDLFAFTARLQKKSGLPLACFGHAGDGNIHVNVMFDKSLAARPVPQPGCPGRIVPAGAGVAGGHHRRARHWPGQKAVVAPGRVPGAALPAPADQKKPGSKGYFESRQVRLNKTDRVLPPARMLHKFDGKSAIPAAAAAAAAPVSTAAAIPAAAAATATIAAAAAAAARRTFFTRPRFIDGQGAALKVFGVEHLDRLFRVFLGGHFDKGKTAGTPRHPVLHDINRHHNARLREMILQVVFCRGEG